MITCTHGHHTVIILISLFYVMLLLICFISLFIHSSLRFFVVVFLFPF